EVVPLGSVRFAPKREMHSNGPGIRISVSLEPFGRAAMQILFFVFAQERIGCIAQEAAGKLILLVPANAAELLIHDEFAIHQIREHGTDHPLRSLGAEYSLYAFEPKMPAEYAGGFQKTSVVRALLFYARLSQKDDPIGN